MIKQSFFLFVLLLSINSKLFGKASEENVKNWLQGEKFVVVKGYIWDDKVEISKADISDLVFVKEATNTKRWTENLSTETYTFNYTYKGKKIKCIGVITYTWAITSGNWSGEKIIAMAMIVSP